MIIPPVGGLTSALPTGATEAAAAGTEATTAPGAGVEATGGGSQGFGGELTEAISSLEESQRSADGASQALATGTVSDPEAAVTTVEDAALEMQLAAQIRSKATEAAQTIFQTQV